MKTTQLGQKGKDKHTLIMVLCCLIPLIAIAAIWTTGIAASNLVFLVVLLCPLMFMFMMWNMHRQKPQ